MRAIKVADYDPCWPLLFAEISTEISILLRTIEAGTVFVRQIKHEGDCYEDEEGWLVDTFDGSSLHILLIHPKGKEIMHYDAFLNREETLANSGERRRYSVVMPL